MLRRFGIRETTANTKHDIGVDADVVIVDVIVIVDVMSRVTIVVVLVTVLQKGAVPRKTSS